MSLGKTLIIILAAYFVGGILGANLMFANIYANGIEKVCDTSPVLAWIDCKSLDNPN